MQVVHAGGKGSQMVSIDEQLVILFNDVGNKVITTIVIMPLDDPT